MLVLKPVTTLLSCEQEWTVRAMVEEPREQGNLSSPCESGMRQVSSNSSCITNSQFACLQFRMESAQSLTSSIQFRYLDAHVSYFESMNMARPSGQKTMLKLVKSCCAKGLGFPHEPFEQSVHVLYGSGIHLFSDYLGVSWDFSDHG